MMIDEAQAHIPVEWLLGAIAAMAASFGGMLAWAMNKMSAGMDALRDAVEESHARHMEAREHWKDEDALHERLEERQNEILKTQEAILGLLKEMSKR